MIYKTNISIKFYNNNFNEFHNIIKNIPCFFWIFIENDKNTYFFNQCDDDLYYLHGYRNILDNDLSSGKFYSVHEITTNISMIQNITLDTINKHHEKNIMRFIKQIEEKDKDKFIVEIIENDELDYVKMLYKNRELLKEKYDFDIIPTQHEYRENSDDISYNGKKISVESLNYSKENEDYDLKQMILSVS
jgi:hypothetical protein